MNRSLRRTLLPAAAATVVCGIVVTLIVGNGSGAVVAKDTGSPVVDTVSVNGVGRVTGVPDVLRLGLGVATTGQSVNAALDAANGDVKRITDVLHHHGVADKDIQTSDLSINPHWDPTIAGRITGYDVSESLSVALRKLPDAGSTISDAATAGGNATRIDGVSFDIEDNTALLGQARDAAFADAKAKAAEYAKLSGRTLGKVSQISENTDVSPRPMPFAGMNATAAKAMAPVPVSAGTQQVSVNTSVVWQLN